MEKHKEQNFNEEENDLGTDRCMPCERLLDDMDKVPYSDLQHQKHRKED